MIKSYIMSN